MIFWSNSFLTVSGTRARARGVTLVTSVSRVTLVPSVSLTVSRQSILTWSLQPHSIRRLRKSSLNLEVSLSSMKNYNFIASTQRQAAKDEIIYRSRSPLSIKRWFAIVLFTVILCLKHWLVSQVGIYAKCYL